MLNATNSKLFIDTYSNSIESRRERSFRRYDNKHYPYFVHDRTRDPRLNRPLRCESRRCHRIAESSIPVLRDPRLGTDPASCVCDRR